MTTRLCLYVLRSGFAALDANDFCTAGGLQVALTTHDWEEHASWIIATKRLMDFAAANHDRICRADVAGSVNGMAQLQVAQAEDIMGKILAIMDNEETQEMLLKIVRENDALSPQQQKMQKMARLLPVAQELSAPVLEEHGFTKEQFTAFWMQLQMFACISPAIESGVARIMGVVG